MKKYACKTIFLPLVWKMCLQEVLEVGVSQGGEKMVTNSILFHKNFALLGKFVACLSFFASSNIRPFMSKELNKRGVRA
jgi:hypothetical protein